MTGKIISPLLAAALALSATKAIAQASFDTADIPQPHLAAARALAAKENSWRHPGLVTCYLYDGQASQNVNMNPNGYKVFDNLYYVGNGKYGPWAIDTSDGIILIDSGNDAKEVDSYILPNMRNVGLDPARLKILILSHGHADHFGGAQYLKDKYGVKIYLSAADWDFAEKWAQGPNPRHQGLPPKRDQVVGDGDTITLGDESIKVYLSPGHTPASLSMMIPVKDHGKPKLLAYFGGVTNRNLSPTMHEAFDKSWGRLARLVSDAKVDGFISAHPNYDDAVFKIQVMRANGDKIPNPFLVGTADTVLFTKIVKECNLNNAAIEKARPTAGRSRGYVANQ